NPGLNCMVGSMNNQTSSFFSNQQSSDYLYLLYSVLGIAAIAGVCCLGFLIHKKWSDNQLATSSNQYRFEAIQESYQHHPNVGLNADGVNERRNSYHQL
ncbi:MAG: hypothetical protein KDH94_01705, partial [Coxiellaceae bacterium]|nr:hypothetical protein [Coxiellaceae bacterium]